MADAKSKMKLGCGYKQSQMDDNSDSHEANKGDPSISDSININIKPYHCCRHLSLLLALVVMPSGTATFDQPAPAPRRNNTKSCQRCRDKYVFIKGRLPQHPYLTDRTCAPRRIKCDGKMPSEERPGEGPYALAAHQLPTT